MTKRNRNDLMYLVHDGCSIFDGEIISWEKVIETADTWAEDDMRVHEVMVSFDHLGKRRISFENCKDCTDEAINAAWCEVNRVPYDTPRMQRELGTVF
ncbi:hypothetical protein [Pelagibacterium luteolum]|uniref:Uncharacterized protein n=1 Tax=Pelagibacterium luteolum TaxID=440168 RepID=A0A1G7TJG1_9HYPH|nr:hypothetical protein [Pelagibacterium luteolum]SDG35341.1 hypothetical protein SAMN04487974_102162 [Pelagibacterium luteolum]